MAAITGARAPRLDGIQGQTSLKSDVVQLSAQVQQHDQRMSDFERQLQDICSQRLVVDSGKSRISGEGQFPHKRPCVDFPQGTRGQEVLIRATTAVAGSFFFWSGAAAQR